MGELEIYFNENVLPALKAFCRETIREVAVEEFNRNPADLAVSLNEFLDAYMEKYRGSEPIKQDEFRRFCEHLKIMLNHYYAEIEERIQQLEMQ